MEIVLERIAKKNTYTIGRLYILSDSDVKRKMISGKNAGDKCSFEHTFNKKLLSLDTYFCDTLEPTWPVTIPKIPRAASWWARTS